MFVVPDEILERLLCCQCHKYLSAKPVKVYPNRGMKCGRCSAAEDAGVISRFELLAEEALFPCVNRFDGCNQMLTYSNVTLHEQTCKPKQYECPICIEVNVTSYDLYRHFKSTHPEALLHNPELTLNIGNELYQSCLYRKGDLLFLIGVQYLRLEQTFAFVAQLLRDEEQCSRVEQTFQLCSLDGTVKYKSKRKVCSSAGGGNVEWLRASVKDEDFPKGVVKCRFSLNTEQVEQLIGLPSSLKKDFKKGFMSVWDPVLTAEVDKTVPVSGDSKVDNAAAGHSVAFGTSAKSFGNQSAYGAQNCTAFGTQSNLRFGTVNQSIFGENTLVSSSNQRSKIFGQPTPPSPFDSSTSQSNNRYRFSTNQAGSSNKPFGSSTAPFGAANIQDQSSTSQIWPSTSQSNSAFGLTNNVGPTITNNRRSNVERRS